MFLFSALVCSSLLPHITALPTLLIRQDGSGTTRPGVTGTHHDFGNVNSGASCSKDAPMKFDPNTMPLVAVGVQGGQSDSKTWHDAWSRPSYCFKRIQVWNRGAKSDGANGNAGSKDGPPVTMVAVDSYNDQDADISDFAWKQLTKMDPGMLIIDWKWLDDPLAPSKELCDSQPDKGASSPECQKAVPAGGLAMLGGGGGGGGSSTTTSPTEQSATTGPGSTASQNGTSTEGSPATGGQGTAEKEQSPSGSSGSEQGTTPTTEGSQSGVQSTTPSQSSPVPNPGSLGATTGTEPVRTTNFKKKKGKKCGLRKIRRRVPVAA